MAKGMTIALDAMGGDHGPSVVVPACARAVKRHANVHFLLVGDETALKPYLAKAGLTAHPRVRVHQASEVVAMDELPSQALRYKKDSSMRVAIDLVKAGTAAACVSAGNTGALMATARFVLKMLPGVDRPAIISAMPGLDPKRPVRVLDLGANVDSSAEHLYQFAVMGSTLAKAVDDNPQPRVALLNVGAEEIKGNDQVRHAAQLLSRSPHINYIGYVEGDDIFKTTADIIVCDGFVGNVSLKSSEGIAKLIGQYIREAFNTNVLTRFLGLVALPVMKLVKRRIDPARYNGANLIGLRGNVIKSHGGTNVLGFGYAIDEAVTAAQKNIPKLISEQIEQALDTD